VATITSPVAGNVSAATPIESKNLSKKRPMMAVSAQPLEKVKLAEMEV
jgi:hypothetical protein